MSVRRRLARFAACILALVAVTLVAGPSARAHDFSPGVLVLTERSAGEFTMAWTEPVDTLGAPAGVKVRWPAGCSASGQVVSCGSRGLDGLVAFEGMHAPRMQVVVHVDYADGRTFERVVSGADPTLSIAPAPGRSWLAWLRLGLEHILTGYDHLAFVLGLLLVVGSERRLVVTITAFTAAHSISLALAALDVIALAPAPVEATIAASVVLVAYESTHDRPTLTRRLPWVVAFVFGLCHGLGFAGALAEIGLPKGATAFALLFFNLGIELGQLAVLAAAVAAWWAMRRLFGDRAWPKRALAYALGSAASFWFIARVAAIVAT